MGQAGDFPWERRAGCAEFPLGRAGLRQIREGEAALTLACALGPRRARSEVGRQEGAY